MYQQIKCSSNFFTLLRVLDSIQQILRFGKGSVLAPARGATTCDAWTGPKCSGTPRGCQGRGQLLLPGSFTDIGGGPRGGPISCPPTLPSFAFPPQIPPPSP